MVEENEAGNIIHQVMDPIQVAVAKDTQERGYPLVLDVASLVIIARNVTDL